MSKLDATNDDLAGKVDELLDSYSVGEIGNAILENLRARVKRYERIKAAYPGFAADKTIKDFIHIHHTKEVLTRYLQALGMSV